MLGDHTGAQAGGIQSLDTGRDSSAARLYDEDFYSWTQQQAALLKAGHIARADLTHIIEEIETLGRSELAALRSSYRLVASHLLKISYQPTHLTSSWTSTIVRERNNIEDILQDNPSLRPRRLATLARAHPSARREASNETNLALTTFPDVCPFSVGQIEDHDFWPPPP